MPNYSSWEALAAAAVEKTRKILEHDVAPVAKNILNKHIQEDIYAAYSPVGSEFGGYDRRGELGSPSNTKAEILDDGTLNITNIAVDSNSVRMQYGFADVSEYNETDRLLYWIEYGLVPNMFNSKPYSWMNARPAVQLTQNEINTSPEITAAIERGINREF